jgi:hypothetical protein
MQINQLSAEERPNQSSNSSEVVGANNAAFQQARPTGVGEGFEIVGIRRHEDSSVRYLVQSCGHKFWKSKEEVTALCPGEVISYYEENIMFSQSQSHKRTKNR